MTEPKPDYADVCLVDILLIVVTTCVFLVLDSKEQVEKCNKLGGVMISQPYGKICVKLEVIGGKK